LDLINVKTAESMEPDFLILPLENFLFSYLFDKLTVKETENVLKYSVKTPLVVMVKFTIYQENCGFSPFLGFSVLI